jgi:hypothetical protein
MNNDKFGFSQGSDGTTQFARLSVPGCGRNEKDGAPVILVEVEHDGKITLLVYGDILSTEPTHIVPLGGAKVEIKQKAAANG